MEFEDFILFLKAKYNQAGYFNAKIEFGERIARIIAEEDAPEQCLSPEQRDALQLFRTRQFQTQITNVEQDEVSTPLEKVAVEEYRMKFSCWKVGRVSKQGRI